MKSVRLIIFWISNIILFLVAFYFFILHIPNADPLFDFMIGYFLIILTTILFSFKRNCNMILYLGITVGIIFGVWALIYFQTSSPQYNGDRILAYISGLIFTIITIYSDYYITNKWKIIEKIN